MSAVAALWARVVDTVPEFWLIVGGTAVWALAWNHLFVRLFKAVDLNASLDAYSIQHKSVDGMSIY